MTTTRLGAQRRPIMNVSVDALSFSRALDIAIALAKDRASTSRVVAINPEKVMTARRDAFLARFIEDADLCLPDGIGVVCALKWLWRLESERVPGADLATALCERSGREGLKIFIYGAREETNARAVEVLRERFPDVLIVGRRNGYVNEDEYDDLVSEINRSDANVLFVALGSPKQEHWIARYAKELNVGLCMGIGGTIDTIAGTVKRAPLGWRRARLEWLYRLIKQPSRIWRQRKIFQFGALALARKLFRGAYANDGAGRSNGG